MAKLDLNGANVLVTGASRGIGPFIARELAGRGARLALVARTVADLEDVAADIATSGAVVVAVPGDVTSRSGRQAIVRDAERLIGPVDVLVNNAGGDPQREFHALNEDEIVEVLHLNLHAPLLLSRQLLPGMLERGRGHVVNVGSTAGHEVYPGGTVYAATKHAVDAITRGLKMDLHGTAIRVSTVDPGLTETDFSLVRFEGDAERAGRVYSTTTPLRAEDIADTIVWIATRPPHVNVSGVVLMPTVQSSVSMVHRPDR